ncbi:HAMP domain-containing protein [Parvibaculum sedimenti]|uniref:histidine kinase n=1 Tax=Parvibaculum sedimenti TaxID=2608632 RepID=A0A6N6VGT7_9HYPH|nr:ATP-binding protein [Parvibaculum sedimenti]KAB7739974.1 HAMP domain-containing protein [Parvibaculum sedimenti]
MFHRLCREWSGGPGEFLRRSISRKILAALVAIYVVTYASTAFIVYSSVSTSIVDSNMQALHELAQRKYERVESVLGAAATDLTAWSQLEVMNDLVSGDLDKRIDSTLDGLKRLYDLSGDIYAYDIKGRLISSTRADNPAGELPSVWRRPEKHLVFIDKHVDPVSHADIVALEIPVFGTFDKNYQIGWLVLTYPWAGVERLLFSGDTATVLKATGSQTSILAADWGPFAGRADADERQAWLSGKDGDIVAGRSAPSKGILGHWQVFALQKTNVTAHLLWRIGGELIMLGGALAVPIIGVGRWLSNRLTAPVVELTRVVSEITETDNLDVRVPEASTDELGTLARSFNRMTESLQRAAGERERFVEDLEALNQTLETKVAARTEELEVAVATQKRLIGDISHEIKSPLARLGMALGLLRRSVNDSRTTKHFDRMEREIDNISALASELLTLMRLDTAADAVEFMVVDICEVITQIASDATYEAPNRKDDMHLFLPTAAVFVMGDAQLLARAIENVVRNALFYTTEKTPVDVIVRAEGDGQVVIEVHDFGPGVPPAALAQLFEPFYRVDDARARNTGGSGIGLAICQRVMILHGGTVRARDNDPKGLVVEMTLPTNRSAA